MEAKINGMDGFSSDEKAKLTQQLEADIHGQGTPGVAYIGGNLPGSVLSSNYHG